MLSAIRRLPKKELADRIIAFSLNECIALKSSVQNARDQL